jgi:hypothetical protein
MQQFTGTFIYRHLDIQRDLPALVSLLEDVEQADQTGDHVSEAAPREQLTWSGQDPALNNRTFSFEAVCRVQDTWYIWYLYARILWYNGS